MEYRKRPSRERGRLSEDDSVFNGFVASVDSANTGFNSSAGRDRINFRPDNNKLIDDRRYLKVKRN